MKELERKGEERRVGLRRGEEISAEERRGENMRKEESGGKERIMEQRRGEESSGEEKEKCIIDDRGSMGQRKRFGSGGRK